MSFVNIDIALLRSFTRIVELGTFNATARDVGLTQAAVTQQMQRLEKQLDIQLFIVSGRKKEVTRAGMKIYDLAKGALQLNDAIVTEAKILKNTTQVIA